MASYLESTYLGGDDLADFDAGNATSSLSAAPGEAGEQDLVTLPGGIVIPRKTLWLILGVLAVAALVVYMRKRDRRLRRLERAADEEGEES